jgi:hypothetical protein
MSVLVQIEDAKLKSLHVEIKALAVNGKQMTLAVFRQLPELDIWRDFDCGDCALIGLPWGRVNYRWTSDGADGPGYWLVWQKTDVLYRAFIPGVVKEWEFLELVHGEHWKHKPEYRAHSDAERAEDQALARATVGRIRAGIDELANLPQLFIAI